MNLALIGDPYYIRMVSRNANYVYKNCDNIYVPEILLDDQICNESSLENAVIEQKQIDEILAFYRGKEVRLPINKTFKNALKNIPTKNIDISCIPVSLQRKCYNPMLLKNRPSILSLSIGPASQQYSVEMLINSHFRRMDLNFYQCFSSESRFILKEQDFNDSCRDIYQDCRADYDLFVGGLAIDNVNELLYEQSPVCSLIKKMSPDSLVISCNATQSHINNNVYPAIDILKYRYNINQIIVVISEYYFNDVLNVSIKIPPQNEFDYSNHFYISDFNRITEAQFIDRLLSNVYLPTGIVPIL